MRCSCCNRNLSDRESVLRHPETLEFLDTCYKCLEDIPIVPLEPKHMKEDNEYEDDLYEEDFDIELWQLNVENEEEDIQ